MEISDTYKIGISYWALPHNIPTSTPAPDHPFVYKMCVFPKRQKGPALAAKYHLDLSRTYVLQYLNPWATKKTMFSFVVEMVVPIDTLVACLSFLGHEFWPNNVPNGILLMSSFANFQKKTNI